VLKDEISISHYSFILRNFIYYLVSMLVLVSGFSVAKSPSNESW
jgi:hypothetical protein